MVAVAYKTRSAALQGKLEAEAQPHAAYPEAASKGHTTEDTEHTAKAEAAGGVGSMQPCAIPRSEAIAAVAAGAAEGAAASGFSATVNLRQPDWVIVCEALPVKAAPGGLVVTVAVIAAAYMRVKPKFAMLSTSAIGI